MRSQEKGSEGVGGWGRDLIEDLSQVKTSFSELTLALQSVNSTTESVSSLGKRISFLYHLSSQSLAMSCPGFISWTKGSVCLGQCYGEGGICAL